jgi:deoxyribodipyrimidine photo-lyase
MSKVNIFWFRRDLRLEDNAGLYQALMSGNKVLPVFIFDKDILDKLEDKEDARLQFVHDSLKDMNEELTKNKFGIEFYYSTPEQAWTEILKKYDVDQVFTNEDYEPYAVNRDEKVKALLNKKGIEFNTYKDQVIFHKNDVLKKDGKPYTVFTPYKNKWLSQFEIGACEAFGSKKLLKNLLELKSPKIPSLKSMGFLKTEVKNKTKTIKKSIVEEYDKNRDFPAVEGTTHLGMHLRFGTVSVRKCIQVGDALNDVWLSELIWREFFMQILFHFPHVVDAPFKEKYSKLDWKNDKKEFNKWCEGKTGYPIVDAGMRELNETGFMHNRVRMMAGSFLVKHLLIDWRWGERYFAQKLLDYELSANNGNWQWVAGTGCDSAPYFRIFNPYTQQKKFDPEFKYIKKWIPEYGTDDYVKEMVDHKSSYHRALAFYKEGLS